MKDTDGEDFSNDNAKRRKKMKKLKAIRYIWRHGHRGGGEVW